MEPELKRWGIVACLSQSMHGLTAKLGRLIGIAAPTGLALAGCAFSLTTIDTNFSGNEFDQRVARSGWVGAESVEAGIAKHLNVERKSDQPVVDYLRQLGARCTPAGRKEVVCRLMRYRQYRSDPPAVNGSVFYQQWDITIHVADDRAKRVTAVYTGKTIR